MFKTMVRREERAIMPGRTRLPLACALTLLAGTLIVFLPTLRNGFVWDDKQYISGNRHVTGSCAGPA